MYNRCGLVKSFNSIVVRLKAASTLMGEALEKLFQFHSGSIKSGRLGAGFGRGRPVSIP